jgi:hypothetical protein
MKNTGGETFQYPLTAVSVLYLIQTLDKSTKHMLRESQWTLHEQTTIRWIEFFQNKRKILKILKQWSESL